MRTHSAPALILVLCTGFGLTSCVDERSQDEPIRRPLWGADSSKFDIFFDDERHDIFELQPHPLVTQIRETNALLVRASSLDLPADWEERTHVNLVADAETLGNRHDLCDGERFSDQPVVLGCTAFLVGPDLAVSAGHCMDDGADYLMVFGYELAEASADPMATFREFPTENIVRVEAYEFQRPVCDRDIAFLRLARPMEGVRPLPYEDTSLEAEDPMVISGFPSGLPLKISIAGQVTRTRERHFEHTVDILQGNSGSPVLGLDGQVKGVHVCSGLGHSDYEPGPDGTCNVAFSHQPTDEGFEANEAYSLAGYEPYLDCLRDADFESCAPMRPE